MNTGGFTKWSIDWERVSVGLLVGAIILVSLMIGVYGP